MKSISLYFVPIMTGQELKKLRKEKGLTQQDIANALKTSKQVVSTWESEKHKISSAYEILLKDFFNITRS
jgi:DNA-binding transcriptional regulator YiaG